MKAKANAIFSDREFLTKRFTVKSPRPGLLTSTSFTESIRILHADAYLRRDGTGSNRFPSQVSICCGMHLLVGRVSLGRKISEEVHEAAVHESDLLKARSTDRAPGLAVAPVPPTGHPQAKRSGREPVPMPTGLAPVPRRPAMAAAVEIEELQPLGPDQNGGEMRPARYRGGGLVRQGVGIPRRERGAGGGLRSVADRLIARDPAQAASATASSVWRAARPSTRIWTFAAASYAMSAQAGFAAISAALSERRSQWNRRVPAAGSASRSTTVRRTRCTVRPEGRQGRQVESAAPQGGALRQEPPEFGEAGVAVAVEGRQRRAGHAPLRLRRRSRKISARLRR